MVSHAKNPFNWVEIYVNDMSRAQKFYESILEIKMTPMELPGNFGDLEMLCFPWSENGGNISGALCKTKDFHPGSGGTLIYFTCDDCSIEESRVKNAGGKILQPKMPIGEHGFCSIIMDTEGNTIGLHSTN